MHGLEEGGRADLSDDAVAFAAFVLAHAVCGEAVIEVRLGGRCLLEWCTACDAMRTFVLPVR